MLLIYIYIYAYVTHIKLAIFRRRPRTDLVQRTIAKQRNIGSRKWVLIYETDFDPLENMSEMKPIGMWNDLTHKKA